MPNATHPTASTTRSVSSKMNTCTAQVFIWSSVRSNLTTNKNLLLSCSTFFHTFTQFPLRFLPPWLGLLPFEGSCGKSMCYCGTYKVTGIFFSHRTFGTGFSLWPIVETFLSAVECKHSLFECLTRTFSGRLWVIFRLRWLSLCLWFYFRKMLNGSV